MEEGPLGLMDSKNNIEEKVIQYYYKFKMKMKNYAIGQSNIDMDKLINLSEEKNSKKRYMKIQQIK